jgi:uncharacterized membrane protein
MASSTAASVRSHQIRLRHVMFAALLPMFLFVLWYSERFIFNHSDEEWAYFFPVRWLILPHALAGLTALLTGPFQFSSRFRQRHLRVHRIMGRVYLASVTVAGFVAFYVSAIHQKQLQDKEWIFALNTAWLITAAIAFSAVRNGNIEAHRQWIARNYALTTVFVTVRVLNAIPIPESYGQGPAWMLVLATLLFTDVGLSWHSVFTNRRLQTPTMTRSVQSPKGALREVDG